MSQITAARDAEQSVSRRSALESYFLRKPHNFDSFGGYGSIRFEPPTPEEIAAQKEAETTALIEKLTPKISEAIERKYKVHLDGLSAEITRLKKAKEEPLTPPAAGDPPARETAVDKKLRLDMEALQKELKAANDKNLEKDAKVAKQRVNTAVASLVTKYGINPEYAEDFERFVHSKFGSQFVSDNENETVTVKVNEYSEAVSFADWADKIEKEGGFKKYINRARRRIRGRQNSSAGGSGDSGKAAFTLQEIAAKPLQQKKERLEKHRSKAVKKISRLA